MRTWRFERHQRELEGVEPPTPPTNLALTDINETSYCAAWLDMSSISNSFCVVSETFSAVMVNGPLVSANGVTVLFAANSI